MISKGQRSNLSALRSKNDFGSPAWYTRSDERASLLRRGAEIEPGEGMKFGAGSDGL